MRRRGTDAVVFARGTRPETVGDAGTAVSAGLRADEAKCRGKDLQRSSAGSGQQVCAGWYWRGTDGLTKEIEAKLRDAGVRMRAGVTPVQARVWWEKYISPALVAAAPDDDVAGTVEEIIRRYEADELATIKREATKTEYKGRIKRLRAAFRTKRYPKAEVQALLPGYLSAVTITQHLHANRERASSANKDIQTLSRMFRLARVRWGLTTFNPCDGIEYLPEAPRDQYVSDERYAQIYNAASPVLQCMLEISTQTGAREGMIFDIRIGDFTRRRSSSGSRRSATRRASPRRPTR